MRERNEQHYGVGLEKTEFQANADRLFMNTTNDNCILSANWARFLSIAAVVLMTSSLAACGDDEPAPQSDASEEVETADTSGERIFPVPDGWEPVASDEMEKYGGLSDSEDLTQINDPAALQRLRENYEKCEVAVDNEGLVRARCTEEVTWSFVNPCPRGRFVVIAQWPLDVPESEWSYCLQDEFDMSIRNCRKRDCSGGYVCEGTLRDAVGDSRFDELAFCVQPSRCLAVAEQTENEGEAACFYDDLTFAETGEIEEQDCSQLEPGECAINCPCTDSVDRCRFLSETRPVGLCAAQLCGNGSDSSCTTFDLGGCVHLADTPDWASEIISEEYADDVRRGYCATPERCETLHARYPGDYNCAYGDD